MHNKRDLIIQHDFFYHLPKLLKDKILPPPPKDDLSRDKNRTQGKEGQGKVHKNHVKSIKEIITDPDPSNMQWHLQDGEKFTKLFYIKQKKCPITSDGKLSYIKLFIQEICDKSCNRVHKLSSEDETAFDQFVNHYHEGGVSKPDF